MRHHNLTAKLTLGLKYSNNNINLTLLLCVNRVAKVMFSAVCSWGSLYRAGPSPPAPSHASVQDQAPLLQVLAPAPPPRHNKACSTRIRLYSFSLPLPTTSEMFKLAASRRLAFNFNAFLFNTVTVAEVSC